MTEPTPKKRSVGRPRLIQKIDPLPKLGIVNEPQIQDNLIELSYDNVSIFKKLFSLLRLMNVKEINIQFNTNYLSSFLSFLSKFKILEKNIF